MYSRTDMQGTLENIFDDLKQQLINNPVDIGAAVMLGNYYYDHDNVAQSIVYYQYALKLNPNQPGVQTDLGTMFWKNGDLGIAERQFRDVIARYPDFGNAYLNLGLLLLRGMQQVAEARAVWSKLVECCPEQPAAAKAQEMLTKYF